MGGCLRRSRPPANNYWFDQISESEAPINGSPLPRLHAACREGDEPTALRLIEEGADINEPDHKTRTPVWHASRMGHIPVIQLLIQRGAFANLENMINYNWGICYRPSPETLWTLLSENQARLLIRCGADVNQVDEHGQTLLSRAVDMGHLQLVRLLVDGGADVNSPSHGGRTLLCQALYALDRWSPCVYMPKVLAELGADVNAPCFRDDTSLYPIHLVYRFYNICHRHDATLRREVLQLFVDRGADVEAIQHDGMMPLLMDIDTDLRQDWSCAEQLFSAAAKDGLTWAYV